LTPDLPFDLLAFMQYWRELPKAEQQAALAAAEKFFSELETPSYLRKILSASDYKKYLRSANLNIANLDMPKFSPRARKGVLASLIVMAADEDENSKLCFTEKMGRYHALLLKPD
jgi:hypothetical protein